MTKHNGIGNTLRSHTNNDPGLSMSYQIRIEGHMDGQWADWFSGLAITLEEDGNTLLTGSVSDQAALFGLLKKVRDLGISLVSVKRVEPCKQNISAKRQKKGENEMNDKMQFIADPEGKWMYRVAGICAVILVVGYLITFPIYFWVGDPPAGSVEAQLAYFANHAVGWWAIVFLMVFTDLLLVPIFFGIYMALKHINMGLMLVALAFKAFLFVILDLAVTWTAYSTMISAGVQYGAATTETQRAALAAAAAYALVIKDSPLAGLYAILIPSLGILFAGLVMFKGIFNKATAYVALAVALTGIIFMGSYLIDSLAVFRIINAFLAMAFYLLVGAKLYKLGRQ